jgi:peptidoglycan hydrolase-like protein with peptidoglycan-binding domain
MNDLRLRQTHADVKELQKFLNKHGFPVSGSGVGSLGNETTYFGSLTYKAVVAFQEKYAESVLVPINSSKGTGFVGQYTRAELNKQLLAENN